jgi:hypothetical protein
MNRLKVILLILSVLCLLSAISGVGSVHLVANNSGSAITATPLNTLGKLAALVMSLLFAGMSYAIHARLSVGWKIGWLALGLSYLNSVVGGISATLQNDPNITFADFWLPCILIVIGGAAIVWYWGRIWFRQKSYFDVPPSR